MEGRVRGAGRAAGFASGSPLVLRSRRPNAELCSSSKRSVVGRRAGRQGRGLRLTTKASLFGVGTPEVLVIGVVALLVFGPKGLADAAKSLGKTLRTFQPTIQELKEVSEEFKSTLEDEIGLDEFKSSMQSPPSRPYTSAGEEAEANLDEMRRSSAAAAWGGLGLTSEHARFSLPRS